MRRVCINLVASVHWLAASASCSHNSTPCHAGLSGHCGGATGAPLPHLYRHRRHTQRRRPRYTRLGSARVGSARESGAGGYNQSQLAARGVIVLQKLLFLPCCRSVHRCLPALRQIIRSGKMPIVLPRTQLRNCFRFASHQTRLAELLPVWALRAIWALRATTGSSGPCP